MRPTILLVFAALLAAHPFATTAAAPIDQGAVIDRDEQYYTVNTDGTWTAERQLEIRVADGRLIKTLAQQAFPYNATLQTLEITEAYTEKPDGTRVAVTTDRIREQQASATPEVAMFVDERVKVAIFPQVAPGDRLVMHVRTRQVRPQIAGQFAELSLPWFYPVRQSRVVYDLPAALPLHADARGWIEKTPGAEAGRVRYEYEYVEHPREQPDANAVAYTDYGDLLAVSTMPDYAALAAAYRRGLAGKTVVTPAVRAVEQKITAGIDGQRAQALALADWVRSNIRYVAVYVGDGGLVPHAADEVLAMRYGDCKDHATLLEALLDAAGIPSTAVLISNGNAYALPTAPTFGVLNHVITYVPGLSLFIDSTDDGVAAGYLPQGDLGKPVVAIANGAVMRTPSSQPDSVTVETWFMLDEPDVQKFTQVRTMRGAAAEKGRMQSRNKSNWTADYVTIDPGDVDGHGDEYVQHATGSLPAPGAAVQFLSGVVPTDPLYVQVMVSDLMSTRPAHDYPCAAHDIEHIAHIRVPRGYRLAGSYAPLELHAPGFDYVAQVAQGQDEITFKRHYQDHPPTNVCKPDDVKARAALYAQIRNNIMGGVLLTPR